MAELYRGLVKWFNDAKGFGFIEHNNGKDVFVHYSVIESEGFRTLKDGEEVEYELREGDKGLNAARVIRVNPPESTKRSERSGQNASVQAVANEEATTSVSRIEIEKIQQTGQQIGDPTEDPTFAHVIAQRQRSAEIDN